MAWLLVVVCSLLASLVALCVIVCLLAMRSLTSTLSDFSAAQAELVVQLAFQATTPREDHLELARAILEDEDRPAKHLVSRHMESDPVIPDTNSWD